MNPIRKAWNYARSLVYAGRMNYHRAWEKVHHQKIGVLERRLGARGLSAEEREKVVREMNYQKARRDEMVRQVHANAIRKTMMRAGAPRKTIERVVQSSLQIGRKKT